MAEGLDDEALFAPYDIDLSKMTPQEAARLRRRAARFAKRPKMRVLFCEKHGGPETIVCRDVDWPGKPGPGEVKVQLWARSVSFVDMLQIAGRHQVRPPLPFIPGSEASGIVLEVGPGVTEFKKTDKILCPVGWVEEAILPVSQVIRAPHNLGFELLSAFRGNYTTAYYGLQRARLQGGETLLVHGASGGVGFAAVDLGKLFGATVIATGGSDKKLAIVADNGADHIINYSSGTFADEVKAITNGRGVDVVFDPVGGTVFDETMKCLAPRARVLVVGFASGQAASVKTNQLLIKDIEVIGYTMAALQRDNPALADRNLRQLIRWVESEHIRPYCSHYLPLANPHDALQAMCDRQVVGKAVLIS